MSQTLKSEMKKCSAKILIKLLLFLKRIQRLILRFGTEL